MISELFFEDALLLDIAWQSTICVVVGLAGSYIFRRRAARAHQVLFLGLIAAVTVPIMSTAVKHFELGVFVEKPAVTGSETEGFSRTDDGETNHYEAAQIAVVEDALPKSGLGEQFSTPIEALSEGVTLSVRLVILYGWAVASMILAVRLAAGFASGIRLLCRAQHLSCKKIQNAVYVAKVKLGISRNVQVYSSNSIKSPVIWCWGRQAVLLAPSSVEHSGDSLDWVSVVCHELAHWKRRDHISGLVAELIVCVLPWHPLLWWAKRRLVRLSEQVCDDWVVSCGQPREDYAESLLDLAPSKQTAFVPAIVGSKKELGNRIRRIVQNRCGEPQAGVWWYSLVSVMAMCIGVGVAFAQTRPASIEAGEERVVHFPKDRSLGMLWIQDIGVKRQIEDFNYWIAAADWEYFCQARGDVLVPSGKQLWLRVDQRAVRDLSPLSQLGPDDLYRLSIAYIPANDNCMPHLASLTGLKVLDLAKTDISSKGMKYLKNLKSLERLTLPARITSKGLVYVARLPSLKALYIKGGRITNNGLRHLAKLTSLEELALSEVAIGDEGLIHLSNLPSLTYLMLWGENFSDAGMVYLKDIDSLRILHLGGLMKITDAGVEHLSHLDKLENINFHWNKNITNKGAVYLSRMKSLKKLDITYSQINDNGLAHLSKVKTLEYLNLPHSGITYTGLVHVTELQNLKYLKVGSASNSPLTDKSLSCVGKLKNLQELHIGGAGFSDEGMDYITQLPHLKKLSLFKAGLLTNNGLAKLGRLKSLKELLLAHSPNISIAGLKSLNTLKNLKSLHISDIVHGNSVMDISGLTNLEKLIISTKGTLKGKQFVREPIYDADLGCLAKLKRLKQLQISPYTLSNAGMEHLAGLTNMVTLAVGGPGLTDNGLKHLSNMKKLNSLTITGNFTDDGLGYLEELKALQHLKIYSANKFSPAALGHLRKELPSLYTLRTGNEGAGYGGRRARATKK